MKRLGGGAKYLTLMQLETQTLFCNEQFLVIIISLRRKGP